jgi:hypothetical protein
MSHCTTIASRRDAISNHSRTVNHLEALKSFKMRRIVITAAGTTTAAGMKAERT